MTVKLTLRHLWTATGQPQVWSLDGDDEDRLRSLIPRLGAFKADAASQRAVLLAEEEIEDGDATLLGAWTRAGANDLVGTISSEPMHPPWLEIRHALHDAVNGP
jgi:hypothetical protein